MDLSLIFTLFLLFGGLASILWGVFTLTGFGLFIFLFDLISLSSKINYSQSRRNYPPAKTVKGKIFGFLLFVIGIAMIVYGFNFEQ